MAIRTVFCFALACLLASCKSDTPPLSRTETPAPAPAAKPLDLDPDELRVAFISHTYYVNRYADLKQMVIDDINQYQPKYVFALGDVVLLNRDNLWQETLSFFSKMNAPVYFGAGNHDIFNFDIVEGLSTDRHYPQWRQQYVDRIGYAHKWVQDPKADFIIINSNDPFFKIQPFLDDALSKANPESPTLLLTHHQIWLERRQNNWVHWYWKSASKEDFSSYIPKFDQIVVGDVWGKLEHRSINGTPTTMVGMGNNDKPAFWVLATLKDNGQFSFEQKTIELPATHPYNH